MSLLLEATRVTEEQEKVRQLQEKVELQKERIHMLGEDIKNTLKLVEKWKHRTVKLKAIIDINMPGNSGHADCDCPLCIVHNEVNRIMGVKND